MPIDAHWDADSDTRPWAETQQAQLRQVPEFIRRLSAASEAWRDHLQGADVSEQTSVESLSSIPFTTKDDLRASQAETTVGNPLGRLQAAPTGELVQIIASSGTTGTPVFFGLTEGDWARWKHSIGNAFFTAGVRRPSVVALTTGMPMVAGGIAYADAIREAGGTLAWVGGQTVPRTATILERLSVDVFVGTASYATFFADRVAEELGKPATELSVRTIIGGGEPGLGVPEIREKVAAAWGATRVSEIMGLGDVLPAMWAECPVGQGMHFTAAPSVLVELIDPDSREHVPWEPGATGEAVYTTLLREASPVVRFRSRDHMQVTAVDCACGRTSPTVRCIGRTDDMLIYKAMNVFPSAIREIALGAGEGRLTGAMRIRKDSAAQVRFDDPIPVEIEVRDDVSVAEQTALLDAIAEQVRQQLRVRIRPEALQPGTIPVGAYKNALTYVPEPR
ncbi:MULTISPECIES: hypothetical protein [unclassified Diaminobutyricimonas]|uniref:phenylacetate--CoA ligase family protein n=1 Tax=unclassified Diaminobutyricimonas TaxID=2643261 RepID=UPI0012F47CE9|nr:MULTISPECIES: hypothetical protein [unclassified Diaminobutyricimonas]